MELLDKHSFRVSSRIAFFVVIISMGKYYPPFWGLYITLFFLVFFFIYIIFFSGKCNLLEGRSNAMSDVTSLQGSCKELTEETVVYLLNQKDISDYYLYYYWLYLILIGLILNILMRGDFKKITWYDIYMYLHKVLFPCISFCSREVYKIFCEYDGMYIYLRHSKWFQSKVTF